MAANAATDPSHETRWICPLSESVVIPARGGSSDLLWAWTLPGWNSLQRSAYKPGGSVFTHQG